MPPLGGARAAGVPAGFLALGTRSQPATALPRFSTGGKQCGASTAQAACAPRRHQPRHAVSGRRSGRRHGFVGEGTAPATQYHDSDFEWAEVEEEGRMAVAEQWRQLRAAADQPTGGEREAEGAAWEGFHATHNRARFFKEKRYLLLEFPQLSVAHPPQHIAEIGCGCGSALLPVLAANPTAHVTACDVSPTALELLSDAAARAGVDASRLSTFVLDASVPPGGASRQPSTTVAAVSGDSSSHGRGTSGARADVGEGTGAAGAGAGFSADGCSPLAGLGADCVLLVFTLSALAPADQPAMLAHAAAALRPGGLLLVRDYGLYDMAQLRFPGAQMLGDSLYRRSDGTLAYFFSTDALRDLTQAASFEAVECKYACVAVRNRNKGSAMRRVFVHGVFRKPGGTGHGAGGPCA